MFFNLFLIHVGVLIYPSDLKFMKMILQPKFIICFRQMIVNRNQFTPNMSLIFNMMECNLMCVH